MNGVGPHVSLVADMRLQPRMERFLAVHRHQLEFSHDNRTLDHEKGLRYRCGGDILLPWFISVSRAARR